MWCHPSERPSEQDPHRAGAAVPGASGAEPSGGGPVTTRRSRWRDGVRPGRVWRWTLPLGVAALALACAPGGGATGPTPGPGEPTSTGAVPSPTGDPTENPGGPSSDPGPGGGGSSGTAAEPDSCADLATSMSPQEQVGQLIMVGIPATSELAPETAEVLEDHHVGSVLLLENTEAGAVAVARLSEDARDAAGAPEGTTTMLAADQEGGQVQRLQGPGLDTIPSAREQADLTDQELQGAAQEWGEQLVEAGVDYDLAPVADVVPEDLEVSNEPIGQLDRGYGPDPEVVADKVTAFVQGMDAAGVATGVKHFPGLGQVQGNTDFTADVVDETTSGSPEELAGFTAAIEAGVDSVMMATATYTRLDPGNQAVFSEAIITDLLRGELGFDAVVISDDLGAAESLADVDPSQRLLGLLQAGGDLGINAEPALTAQMVQGVLDEAEADPDFAATLPEHVTRVLELKADRGLADCDG